MPAKSQALLGVRVVIAESFERIHRSNLIGMGVIPLEYRNGHRPPVVDGSETIRIHGLGALRVGTTDIAVDVIRADDASESVTVHLRLDTESEAAYIRHGGTLPFVIRQVLR